MKGLAIKDVAERTGIAAGTIRMWEQRYGFPVPERTPSGYRRYSEQDAETLRRVLAYRKGGLSVPAALERARAAAEPTDRPSIYGAIAASGVPVTPQVLRKRTLIAISRAIEDETIARAAGPVIVAAFQSAANYRAVEHRYRRLAKVSDATVVFADFDRVREEPGEVVEVPISLEDAVGNEWAVVVDAPGYAACLLAWEHPRPEGEEADGDRRFEAMWTMDPQVVRRAALIGAALAGRADPKVGSRVEGLLRERPLAVDAPAPGLTALCNRMIGYLEG
ncbi:MAG: MerR family transcriptional regulator [Actinomycetota bacterium]|nr:MerR family transcriptional regulator [Actinomycetota bacterium]